MQATYLGHLPFDRALVAQEEALSCVRAGTADGVILGFESDPVVTYGVRGDPESDLMHSQDCFRRLGFQFHKLDRGGQATMHLPGQLVIFPVVAIRSMGPRAWIDFLIRITREMLAVEGLETHWKSEAPGLYSHHGKVVSLGIRLRHGVSTHGLAIQVHNDLEPFSWIRTCGVASAPMDRLRTSLSLEEIFTRWTQAFRQTWS
ncbi:MAG: lipoyl(octanoyl) transferase LipB [Bdellovibrionales bacterium]